MAKTALLGQNDNLAIENLKQSVGRSVFNLSDSISLPIDVVVDQLRYAVPCPTDMVECITFHDKYFSPYLYFKKPAEKTSDVSVDSSVSE